MKELMDKYNELESAEKCCKECIENIREEMDDLARQIPVDYEDKIRKEYFKKEETYNKNKMNLKIIERKMYILREAMDILEGIGVDYCG